MKIKGRREIKFGQSKKLLFAPNFQRDKNLTALGQRQERTRTTEGQNKRTQSFITRKKAVKTSSAINILALLRAEKRQQIDIDLIFEITTILTSNNQKRSFPQTAFNVHLINKLFAKANTKELTHHSKKINKIYYLF